MEAKLIRETGANNPRLQQIAPLPRDLTIGASLVAATSRTCKRRFGAGRWHNRGLGGRKVDDLISCAGATQSGWRSATTSSTSPTNSP